MDIQRYINATKAYVGSRKINFLTFFFPSLTTDIPRNGKVPFGKHAIYLITMAKHS